MTSKSLTQDELKERVSYNPYTGDFKSSLPTKTVSIKCPEIGYISKTDGYHYIYVSGFGRFLAHRLAWLYMTGEMPDGEIDHINHIKTDNRAINLRVVTHKENGRNTSKPSNNTSGVVGVHWRKDRSKWQCHIKVDGKKLNLGCFSCLDEATKVRKEAEVKYGFHENHGV